MAYVYNISMEVLVLAMCALLWSSEWWWWTWHFSKGKRACCGGGQHEGEVEGRWSSPYCCRCRHQVNTALINVPACILWWWSAQEGGGGEMGLTTLIVGVIIMGISTMIGQDQYSREGNIPCHLSHISIPKSVPWISLCVWWWWGRLKIEPENIRWMRRGGVAYLGHASCTEKPFHRVSETGGAVRDDGGASAAVKIRRTHKLYNLPNWGMTRRYTKSRANASLINVFGLGKPASITNLVYIWKTKDSGIPLVI